MWYSDAHRWNRSYTERLDELIRDPGMEDSWGGFGEGEAVRGLFEARVHGNPVLDSSTIGWMENTAQKRAENDAYRAEQESGQATFGFDELFATMPGATDYV